MVVRIGIQGDKCSNNERACKLFCKKRGIKDYEIVYLISTSKVLEYLNKGLIDYGVFAYKTDNGYVEETRNAMLKFRFRKLDELWLEIRHFLLSKVLMDKHYFERVVSHPQALKEHESEIKEFLGNIEFVDFEDTALSAKFLSEGKFDNKTLVVSPKNCEEIYGLKVVKELKYVYNTLFFFVSR